MVLGRVLGSKMMSGGSWMLIMIMTMIVDDIDDKCNNVDVGSFMLKVDDDDLDSS